MGKTGLTRAEARMISALTYVVVRPFIEVSRENFDMMLAELRAAARECDPASPMVGPVVVPARELSVADPKGPEWTWVRSIACEALAVFSMRQFGALQ